jgi:hypothetical protein
MHLSMTAKAKPIKGRGKAPPQRANAETRGKGARPGRVSGRQCRCATLLPIVHILSRVRYSIQPIFELLLALLRRLTDQHGGGHG